MTDLAEFATAFRLGKNILEYVSFSRYLLTLIYSFNSSICLSILFDDDGCNFCTFVRSLTAAVKSSTDELIGK